ncbi:MAG: TlpA family protein disulfide reductase [Gammaproteobacteria bacterium]|nr:TlpA family protein disulfide reductase [Gammaproteobacteria bacterium]
MLIVNFWAPWCVPCRREIPALVEIQRQFEGKVQILGLALDSVENIRAFEADQMMNYPSFLVGAEIPMYSNAFGNTSGGLPFTAILDRERKIRYVHNGELTTEQLHEKITDLL